MKSESKHLEEAEYSSKVLWALLVFLWAGLVQSVSEYIIPMGQSSVKDSAAECPIPNL